MAAKSLVTTKSPIDSWNKFIETLLEAKAHWEDHKEVVRRFGPIENLPIEAQRIMRYASVHRATDFERGLLQLLNHWRVSGGLDAMLIVIKKESAKEGKKDEKK